MPDSQRYPLSGKRCGRIPINNLDNLKGTFVNYTNSPFKPRWLGLATLNTIHLQNSRLQLSLSG